MAQAVIGRWGKNLAIRLPAEVARTAGLGEGERVEIVSSGEALIVRKLPAEVAAEAIVFRQVFEGMARALPRGLYWGEDQGRERDEE